MFKVFGYTNLGNYARFTVFKKLLDKLDLPENPKILDLGTGFGEYAVYLSDIYPNAEIHAIDIDADRINTLGKVIKGLKVENVKASCSYVEEYNETDFDLIFAIDVFEHILPENMPFKVAYEKLKKGGHFLVKIPNKDQRTILKESLFEEHQDWLEDEHVGQIYDLDGLSQRMSDEGFEVIYQAYSDGIVSRAAWETDYLIRQAGSLPHLLSLPITKGLVHLDRIVHSNKWGNAIQVIGRK